MSHKPKYHLGKRSRKNLQGVHHDLIEVIERAIEITAVDFTVIEGLRTKKRQRELVAKGASQTMNSRHLTGHAVDLMALVGGKGSWDWPLYYKITEAVQEAADELGIRIESGSMWERFPDGPHHQLSRRDYPA